METTTSVWLVFTMIVCRADFIIPQKTPFLVKTCLKRQLTSKNILSIQKKSKTFLFLGDDVDEDEHVVESGRVRRYSIGERRKQIREQAFGRGAMTERNKLLMAVSIYRNKI